MTIEKVNETQLPFVDGVPSVGQTRIDWIQNGEYLDAAESAIDNGGALNRGAVKIQQNVDKVNTELNLTKSALNTTIDLINVHDAILNASGDGTNLYDRVNDLETETTHINQHIDGLELKDLEHTNQITEINTKINTDIDPQIINIKRMLGNYKGFDQDGNPDVNAPGLGVKGQVERNMENIVAHGNRLNALESWWDGDTPDVLIQNVDQLREEIGNRSDKKPQNIYTRLNSIETHVVNAEQELSRIESDIGFGQYPKNYTNHAGSVVVINNVNEYVNAIVADLDQVESELSSMSDVLDQAVLDIEDIKQTDISTNQRVDNLESLVGLSPTDGLRGEVKLLDIREANNADRFNGLINNLNDVVNLELKPQVNSIEADVNLLKPAMFGTGLDTDPDLIKLGVKATNEQMYTEMYIPFITGSGFILDSTEQRVDANYVRRYVNDNWEWVADDTYDVVVGNNKVVRNISGIQAIGYEGSNVVYGSHGNGISIRGILNESLNFGATNSIKVSDVDVIKFNDLMEIGNNNVLQFNVSTKDNLTVGYGGLTKKIIHAGNISEYVNDIDPRTGFILNLNAGIDANTSTNPINLIKLNNTDNIVLGVSTNDLLIESPVNKLVLKLGSSISSYTTDLTIANMLTLATVGANKYSVLGDTNAAGAIRTIGNDLTTAKVIDNNDNTFTIWHDGIDAPNDNAFYARKNGAWVAFNTGGSGGLADDAPDNGLPYLRTSLNGTAYWEALGDRDIIMAETKGIKFNTTDGVVNGLLVSNLGNMTLGNIGTNNTVSIGGLIDNMTLDRSLIVKSKKLDNSALDILQIENDGIVLCDTVFDGQASIRTLTGDKQIWHDGIDAPTDGKYYARKDGIWTMVFNGIDPNADVNTTGSYLSKNITIGSVEIIGSDNIVNFGQNNTYTKFNGNVLSFKLAQPADGDKTSITGMADGQEINVIAIKDNIAGNTQIKLGDPTTDLTLSAVNATLNGYDITTKADDAPADGKRYSRMNGDWVESYYYGDFTNAPTNPVEGTVFFEFVN